MSHRPMEFHSSDKPSLFSLSRASLGRRLQEINPPAMTTALLSIEDHKDDKNVYRIELIWHYNVYRDGTDSVDVLFTVVVKPLRIRLGFPELV